MIELDEKALKAFDQILKEVEHTEKTHTRNAGTDYRARQFFVEYGSDFRAYLATTRSALPVGGEKAVAWARPSAIDALLNGDEPSLEGIHTMLSAVKGRYNTVPLFTHPATDEIERVLEPFAYALDDQGNPDDLDAPDELLLHNAVSITFGDCRAARNLLLKLKGGRPLAQKSERG